LLAVEALQALEHSQRRPGPPLLFSRVHAAVAQQASEALGVQPKPRFYPRHLQCRPVWGALPWERATVAVEPQAVAVVEVAPSQPPRKAAEQQVRIPPWLGVVQ
jgi:hypothetical protein